MPAGDFSKQIKLIIEARGRPGKGMNEFKKMISDLQSKVAPLAKGLAGLETPIEILGKLSKLSFAAVKRSTDSFTKSVLALNQGLKAQIQLLGKLKTTGVTARSKIAKKTEPAEMEKIFSVLNTEDLAKFQANLRKAHTYFKTFEDRVKTTTETIRRNFKGIFNEDVITRQMPFMNKFTGSVDLLSKKINIAKQRIDNWRDSAEQMNTMIHEHVELLIRESGVYDVLMNKYKMTKVEADALSHTYAKEITQQIMLDRWLNTNTKSRERNTEAIRRQKISMSAEQIKLVGAAGGGIRIAAAGGGATGPLNEQFALWGKLTTAIQKAQREAQIFGDKLGAHIGTIAAINSEMGKLASEAGIAFRPALVTKFFKGLDDTIIRLRLAREEMEEFGARTKALERDITAFDKLKRQLVVTKGDTKELETSITALGEKIKIAFAVKFGGVAEYEKIASAFKHISSEAERFKLTFQEIGRSTQGMEKLKTLTAVLKAEITILNDELMRLVLNEGNVLSKMEESAGVTAQQIGATDANTGALKRQNEMLQQEIQQRQQLIIEYHAMIILHARLAKAGKDTSGTMRDLNSIIGKRNALIRDGRITTEQFMIKEKQHVAGLSRESQQHVLVGNALRQEIALRRTATGSMEAQAVMQGKLIREMGKAPTKFEFEQQIEQLNILLKSTHQEIAKINLAKRGLVPGPELRRLEASLTRLRNVSVSTERAISTLSERMRVTLPNSADASRAASRMTAEGFVAMIKSQAAWMAGFTLIFGTIYKFREAIESQVEIMNESARVMRTMRSEIMTMAETQREVVKIIETSLRKWGEETENISQALYELGSAGLSAEESLAALPPILDMIVGGESEVIQTTRTVAGVYMNMTGAIVNVEGELVHMGETLGRLGKQFDRNASAGMKFVRIADIMTAAVRDHLVEIDELNQGLKFMIAVGRMANLTLEEMVGIIAVLGDNMIRSGTAGRSMRRILSAITKDADKFAEAFGIALDPTKPVDFMNILSQLHERMSKGALTAEELGLVFERLGLRGAPAFIILAEKFNAVQAAIGGLENSAAGAAKEMARIQLEKPARQAAILRENLLALIRQGLKPLINVVIGVMVVVNKFVLVLQTVDRAVLGLLGVVVSFIAPFLVLLGTFRLFGKILKSEFVLGIFKATKAAEVGFVGMEKSMGIMGVTTNKVTANMGKLQKSTLGVGTAFSRLKGFIVANPYLVAAAAIIALYYAYKKLNEVMTFSIKKHTEEIQKMQESIEATSQRIRSIERYVEIVSTYKTMEEKLNIIRSESLDKVEGLIAYTNTYGEVVLKTTESLGRMLEVEEELAQVQREKSALKAVERWQKLQKEIKSTMNVFQSFVKVMKATEGEKVTDDLEQAISVIRIKMPRIGTFMLDAVTAYKSAISIGMDAQKATESLMKSFEDYASKVRKGFLDNKEELIANIKLLEKNKDLLDRIRADNQGSIIPGLDKTLKEVKELLGILNKVKGVRRTIPKEKIEIFSHDELRRYEEFVEKMRKSPRPIDVSPDDERNFGESISKYKKHLKAIEEFDKKHAIIFENSQKRMARATGIGLETMNNSWKMFTEDQKKEFDEMVGNIDKRISEIVKNTGKSWEEARRIAENESVRFIAKIVTNFRRQMEALDIASIFKSTEDLDEIVLGSPKDVIKIWSAAFGEMSGVIATGIGKSSRDVLKIWEDFNMNKPIEEAKKFARSVEIFTEDFNILFDLSKAEDQLKAADELVKKFDEIRDQKEKIAGLIVSNTRKIRDQEMQLDRLGVGFARISTEAASAKIDKVYRDAASAARDLAGEIIKQIDLKEKLGISYNTIKDLEDQIYKATASNFKDLQTQHEGFIKSRIALEIKLFEVQKQLEVAEGAATKDAQKIKDLKDSQALTVEKMLAIQRAQTENEERRKATYERETIELARQLQFQMDQVKMTTEMAQKYGEMAEDDSRTASERRKYAKESERYANQATTAAKTASSIDVKRIEMAKEMGVNYRDHREEIKKTMVESQSLIKDAFTAQMTAIQDENKAREEQNEKLKKYYKDLEALLEGLKEKQENINAATGNTVSKYAEMIKSMKSIIDEAVKLNTELAKPIEKKMVIRVTTMHESAGGGSFAGGIISGFHSGGVASISNLIPGFQGGGKTSSALTNDKLKKEIEKEIDKSVKKTLADFFRRLREKHDKPGGVTVVGERGFTGMLTPVRVTQGEGLFMPKETRKYFSALSQINSGSSKPLPNDLRMSGVFKGSAGVDSINTMVPAGSFIMSHRGMKAMNQWDRDIKQASEGGFISGYQGGGIVESKGTTRGLDEPADIGTININITDPSGTTTSVPVQGNVSDLKKLKRALERERLTKVQ